MPIDATKQNLTTLKFKIDKGLITWAGVYFPNGCQGRVYAKLYFQAHQILPRAQESWCHGNAGWWEGYMYIPVTAHPLEILVEAWADETNFAHTLQIGLEIRPWLLSPRWEELIDGLHALLREFGIEIPEYTPQEYKP